jgi:hypothetical protein
VGDGLTPFARSAATFALPAAPAAGAVALTAFVNGGYFPTEWGWPALGSLLVVVLAVLIRKRLALGKLELVVLGALAGVTGWSALSLVGSGS